MAKAKDEEDAAAQMPLEPLTDEDRLELLDQLIATDFKLLKSRDDYSVLQIKWRKKINGYQEQVRQILTRLGQG